MEKSLEDINILKGIGIFLVVFGHLHEGSEGPCWWMLLRNVIYTFHMPLFFIVSGYLYVFASNNIIPYRDYIKKITPRFLIPITVFTFIVAIYKGALQYFLNFDIVKNPVTIQLFINHFLNPQLGNFAIYLWFLYTLFLIQFFFPLLKKVVRYEEFWLIFFLCASKFVWPKYFCLNLVIKNYPFYIAGIIIFKYKLIIHNLSYSKLTLFFYFSLLLGSYCYFFSQSVNFFFSYFLLGIFMTIFIWMFILLFLDSGLLKIWGYIGLISIDVYLWHPIFLGITKAILFRLRVFNFLFQSLICAFTAIILCVITHAIISKNKKILFLLYGR